MKRTTLDAARGLLLSKLRLHIYKERSGLPDTSWATLVKLEERFIKAHKEVWKEELTSWGLASGNPPELVALIANALEQAIEDTVTHFDTLPPEWVTKQAREWASNFQPCDLIAEGAK